MSDPIGNQIRNVLNHGVGDIIPYNDDVLDDAECVFRGLHKGSHKIKALRDLYYICHATGQVDRYLKITQEARSMPELLPYKVDVLYFAGSICEDDCRYDQALEYYLRCLEFDTESDWFRYNRAVNAAFCYLMKGDPFKAREHCEAAIVINPENWLAWKNLGMAFEALENFRDAANAYARAVRLSRGDIGPIIYLRELVKRHRDKIVNFEEMRDELLEKGVVIAP